MQLRYRDAAYTLTQSVLETEASNLTATYRGQAYLVRKPSNLSKPIGQPGHILKFRGTSYL